MAGLRRKDARLRGKIFLSGRRFGPGPTRPQVPRHRAKGHHSRPPLPRKRHQRKSVYFLLGLFELPYEETFFCCNHRKIKNVATIRHNPLIKLRDRLNKALKKLTTKQRGELNGRSSLSRNISATSRVLSATAVQHCSLTNARILFKFWKPFLSNLMRPQSDYYSKFAKRSGLLTPCPRIIPPGFRNHRTPADR